MHTPEPIPHFLACFLAALMMTSTAVAQDAPETVSPQVLLADIRLRAVQEILDASRSEDHFIRANAIEACQSMPERALPMAQIGVQDPSPVVRFAALVTIGKLKLDTLGPIAAKHVQDPNESVRAAAYFAAHQCGQEVNPTRLARLLQSEDPGVRGNVAMLLGLMGERSAVPMLIDIPTRHPMHRASAADQALVHIQIAEAAVRLGDMQQLNALRAGMFSEFDDVRLMTVLMLGEIEDHRMITAIEPLLHKPPLELQIAAARAMAMLDKPDGLPVLLEGARMDEKLVRDRARQVLDQAKRQNQRIDPSASLLLDDPAEQTRVAALMRAQSAFGLALFDNLEAAQALSDLLGDEDPHVRVAAAASIIRAINGRQLARAGDDR